MRIPALAILAIATVSAAGPAAPQTYAPGYPVCLHVWGPANYYECRYTSLAQCNASASGRAAQCVIDPYIASAVEPMGRPYRRNRSVYY
jgi:hypothetical protein